MLAKRGMGGSVVVATVGFRRLRSAGTTSPQRDRSNGPIGAGRGSMAVWAKITATGTENCGAPASPCLLFQPSGDAHLTWCSQYGHWSKGNNYQAYTVAYGHHTSQRIRSDPRADHRWCFGVALGRTTLSPKRRAEAISGHLLRTARSLPAEQSKSA